MATDDVANAYLRPATVDSLANVYFIGPFGSRVSFASQQRRALNTVWALSHFGKIGRGTHVAVIGAGLAGVTAAAAAAAKGAQVCVYEKASDVLQAQKQAYHRYVHPSVNFWPELPLTPTTTFPFFDWTAGMCSDVLKCIFDDWDQNIKDKMEQVWRNSPVLRIDSDSVAPKVRVFAGDIGKDKNSAPSEADFDQVIVTSGFGDEAIIEGTAADHYWSHDTLNHLLESDCDRFVVSGTGDGGLIDLFRLIHKKFRDGRLSVELIQLLDRHKQTDQVLRIEERGWIFSDNRDRACASLADGYSKLIESLPNAIADFLDESLTIPEHRKVTLIGELPAPFSIAAAPIHKVLVAHALSRKKITYVSGLLTRKDNQFFVETETGIDLLTDEHVIARHGAENPPILQFIDNKDDLVGLVRRQQEFSRLVYLSDFPDDFFNGMPGYPKYDPRDPAFIDSRLSAVTTYLWAEHRLRPHVWFDGSLGRWTIGVSNNSRPSSAKVELPKYLFGIPVIWWEKSRIGGRPRA